MTQSKGHPHAALMLEYAKDAAEHAEPWLLWERSDDDGANWDPMMLGEGFDARWMYRRKPRTIRIGEIDVPEPLRVEPEPSTPCFVPSIFNADISDDDKLVWMGSEAAGRLLRRGFLHATREAAEAHARALIAVSGGEV